jgi:hypothetical protein
MISAKRTTACGSTAGRRPTRSGRVGQLCGLLAITIGAALLDAAMTAPARAQSDEKDVTAVVLRFFDGMRTRDTALMRSTVLPSAVLVSVGDTNDLGRTRPVDQFIQRVGAGTGVPGNEQIKDPKIQIDGPFASLWAYFTLSRGGQIDHCGVDLFLLRKGPTGGWKVFYVADTHRTVNCPAITP